LLDIKMTIRGSNLWRQLNSGEKHDQAFCRFSFVFCIYILICFVGETSWASFGNYNSILIGDLSAGMGGAATAVVGDVSSSSFYNPATLGRLKGEAFSATVGIYKKFDTVYGEDQEFATAPLRVNQGFFRSLPASTGNVIEFQGYKLGLSIVVPEYETYRGEIRKSDTVTSTLNYVDESLWVGGSIAKELSAKNSLGLTLYYTARSYVRSINDRTNPSISKSTIYTQERNLTENSVVAILGWHHQLRRRWALGMSARLPAFRVAGEAKINESKTEMDLSGPSLVTYDPEIPALGSPAKIPGRLSLGVSYEPSTRWLWAMDATYYEGYSFEDLDSPEYSSRIDLHSVTNVSIGAQWSWYNWLKFRGGLYTNFSPHANPDPEVQHLQGDRLDMLGFSANFLFIAKNKVGYTFGGYYTGGRGRSIQRVNQAYEVMTITHHVFTMLIGTHFYF
jgi:hypothetical protein